MPKRESVPPRNPKVVTKPHLTQAELRNLARLVYLGNLVINSSRDKGQRIEKYDQVEDRILRWAHDEGLTELVEECEAGHAHPSSLLEEDIEITAYLDDHTDQLFWEELAHRLADRDLFRDHDPDLLVTMPTEQKIALKEPYLDRYRKLLEEDGLDLLRHQD